MKIDYDAETDTLNILFRDCLIKESDEIRPGVVADFGEDNLLVGLEIFEASRTIEKTREVQFAVAG